MLPGAEVVAETAKIQDADRAVSKELALEAWLGRPRPSECAESVMRLTAGAQ